MNVSLDAYTLSKCSFHGHVFISSTQFGGVYFDDHVWQQSGQSWCANLDYLDFCTLCAKITVGRIEGPNEMPRIEPKLSSCKANALHIVLLLQLLLYPVFNDTICFSAIVLCVCSMFFDNCTLFDISTPLSVGCHFISV